MIFPTMLYHPKHGAVVVESPEELASLPPSWTANPPANSVSVSPPVIRFQDVPEERKTLTLPRKNKPAQPTAQS